MITGFSLHSISVTEHVYKWVRLSEIYWPIYQYSIFFYCLKFVSGIGHIANVV